MRLIIFQGSRLGYGKYLDTKHVPSYRAISLYDGSELWRLDVRMTDSYSRDVDGSGIICNDSLFIGLENGTLAIINPTILDQKNKKNYPKTLNEIPLYNDSDVIKHNHNLVTESSPSILNNHIYIASGSGHIFGYNKKLKKIDWDYYIGADIDGSTVITKDSSILIGFEKEFLEGNGGVLKISPFSFFAFWITSFRVLTVVLQISSGLCSTHPLLGKYWVNSFCDEKIGLPFRSKRIDLFDVVPASIEIINFFIT